jgi:iron complex outermembrane recepter protein
VFRANLTGFYYDYKDLQISRIINRTSFNDNTNASIYGLEGEFIVAPTRNWLFNLNASWLKTEVKDLQLLDTRDPAAGMSDTVIIKDLQGGANCVLRVPGSPALANGIVGAINAGLGLRAPVAVPGTGTTGAFSLCSVLASTAAAPPPALSTALGLPVGVALPIVFDAASSQPKLPDGNIVDVSGNRLPNSPEFKVSFGAQYTHEMNSGWTIVARGDIIFTDSTFSRTFNRPIDRVPSYEVVNGQIQVNAPDNRFFFRAFVQNAFGSDAITGQYVTDPSSGLFTNVFTLEPRRYGIAAGFNF